MEGRMDVDFGVTYVLFLMPKKLAAPHSSMYYEQQWLDRGLDIKYMRFLLPQAGELAEPEVEIELDEYRSYNRSKRSGLSTAK